jgi:hypothetical protein
MSRSAGPGVLALLFALAVTTASGQQREFVEVQRANADALRSYTWKSRTELTLKGEVMNVRLEQVRFDFDGRLQKTQIGGGSAAASESHVGRRGGPVRQRVVARKQDEFKELMNDLATLAGSYAHLSPDTLEAFAARATITKGQGIEPAWLRVQGRGVLSGTDEMMVWIDAARLMMRRVEITTVLDGKPVHIGVDYRSLENGLTYQTRAIVRYPEKQLEVTIENFDYKFAGRLR